MKKSWALLFVCAVTFLFAGLAQAQVWRGMGRVQGTVVDKADGKAIKGAKVTLTSTKAVGTTNAGPAPITTDGRGNWAALGLIGGVWNVDVAADGYQTRKLSVNVSEVERMPSMKIELERIEQPKEVTREAIQVDGKEISPEIAAALASANQAMLDQKWADAIAGYEKARTVLPDNLKIKFALARAYYATKDLKKAAALLREVHQAETANTTAALLLATTLVEDGQLTEGAAVLDSLPAGTVTDPTVINNVGILLINKNNPAEAVKYFDRAIAIAPSSAEAYYYRGLANVQLKKMDAAKADLKKSVELAPDGPDAKDARALLSQLK